MGEKRSTDPESAKWVGGMWNGGENRDPLGGFDGSSIEHFRGVKGAAIGAARAGRWCVADKALLATSWGAEAPRGIDSPGSTSGGFRLRTSHIGR
jgi:hypothetical protein